MARGVAGKNSVTKYGSKSGKPGQSHFYRWGKGGPGSGEGKCIHCSCKLRFVKGGKRGGKVREYWNHGKWSSTEPACKKRSESKPTKKAA